MRRLGLALIAYLAVSLPAQARQPLPSGTFVFYLSGGALYELCTSANPAEQTECFGYIEGIIDASIDDTRPMGPDCVGSGVKAYELRNAVVAFLRKEKTLHSIRAVVAVRMALVKFCKR
jgi:hypothetical protein